MQNSKTRLKQITQKLLQSEERYDELTAIINDLNQLLLSISGLDLNNVQNREPIYLPNGKAIGPVWAGMCVNEFLRTKRFIRGIFQGIQSALKTFSARPINILYAGTGPFATLMMPLTTVFSSAEINLTLLEINPHSIQCLKKVIAAFQVENYINEIICCDATRYQVGQGIPIHMVITETMQNALQKEPQVGITMNLLPQMVGTGILIPQNIVIEAVLINPNKDRQRMTGLLNGRVTECYHVLGRIFELNKYTPRQYPLIFANLNDQCLFPKVAIEISQTIPPEYNQLCLLTTIQVFAAEQLTPWQSSLTLPQKIMRLDQAQNSLNKIIFQYQMNQKPGFGYEMQ